MNHNLFFKRKEKKKTRRRNPGKCPLLQLGIPGFHQITFAVSCSLEVNSSKELTLIFLCSGVYRSHRWCWIGTLNTYPRYLKNDSASYSRTEIFVHFKQAECRISRLGGGGEGKNHQDPYAYLKSRKQTELTGSQHSGTSWKCNTLLI